MKDLFPSDFLTAIERLSIDVTSPTASVVPGAHLSRAAGSSLDFRDFRQYSSGDDLRRVDWNIYRRTGHLFLKRFDHPTHVPVYLLLDTSDSMFIEEPPRYTTAARITAAVASAVLRTHDRVDIVPFADRSAPPLQRLGRRSQVPQAMAYLSSLRSGGPGSIRYAVETLLRHGQRAGVAIIISDFFEDAGIDAMTAALAQLPHRLVLVQITQPTDLTPVLTHEAELVDCETDRSAPVFPSPETIVRYRRAYDAYHDGLRSFAQRRRCRFVQIDAGGPILEQLERLFPGGVLHVAEGVR